VIKPNQTGVLFDRLTSWNKYDGNQNMRKSVEKSTVEFSKLRKQIELLGIEVKGLDEKAETGRLELKTKFINQDFINELDKSVCSSSTLEVLGLADSSYC
jgi:hypothetical protein